MNKQIELAIVHPAAVRLAYLHLTKREGATAQEVLSDAQKGIDSERFAACNLAEHTPVLFNEIGMNSIEELIQTFADLDLALKNKDEEESLIHLAKLLGQKQLNLKSV